MFIYRFFQTTGKHERLLLLFNSKNYLKSYLLVLPIFLLGSYILTQQFKPSEELKWNFQQIYPEIYLERVKGL